MEPKGRRAKLEGGGGDSWLTARGGTQRDPIRGGRENVSPRGGMECEPRPLTPLCRAPAGAHLIMGIGGSF